MSDTWLIVRSNRNAREIAGSLERALRILNMGLPFTINSWTKELDTARRALSADPLALLRDE